MQTRPPTQTQTRTKPKPNLSEIKKKLENLKEGEVMVVCNSMMRLNIRKSGDKYAILYRDVFNEYKFIDDLSKTRVANILYSLSLLRYTIL